MVFQYGKNEMKMSNSIRKVDTINYYDMVAGILPGRSPSIFHNEHRYYWAKDRVLKRIEKMEADMRELKGNL